MSRCHVGRISWRIRLRVCVGRGSSSSIVVAVVKSNSDANKPDVTNLLSCPLRNTSCSINRHPKYTISSTSMHVDCAPSSHIEPSEDIQAEPFVSPRPLRTFRCWTQRPLDQVNVPTADNTVIPASTPSIQWPWFIARVAHLCLHLLHAYAEDQVRRLCPYSTPYLRPCHSRQMPL
jgi:hypothetical protein